MQSSSTNILVLNTCPDRDVAESISQQLVKQKLAACINIVPGLTSVYEWQGQIQTDSEVLLLIKTQTSRYAELEQQLLSLHPYELPEIITVSIDSGYPPYLNWLNSSLEQ